MKLLLIEDEKRMAQALCEILRQEHYTVDHCADGIDGAAACVLSACHGSAAHSAHLWRYHIAA